jgi:hypothetical protein
MPDILMGKTLCHWLVKSSVPLMVKHLYHKLVKSHHGREEAPVGKRENVESYDERQHEPVVHQETYPLLETQFLSCL